MTSRLTDVHLDMASDAGMVNILRGITLDIAAGEIAAVVGPSGAGKSSLMMVAGGLERATSGRVEVAGRDLGAARRRRPRALPPRSSRHRLPGLPPHPDHDGARERRAAAGVRRPSPMPSSAPRRRWSAVGLGHRLGHYPAQLSGGEQQRVAVARAFVGQPKLLLADEPTGNLDGATGQQVMDLLFELARAEGATLMLITHDMALAERCDRVLRIADGLLVADRRARRAAARRAMSGSPNLRLAVRLARREMRAGLGGFRLFIACLALGVGADRRHPVVQPRRRGRPARRRARDPRRRRRGVAALPRGRRPSRSPGCASRASSSRWIDIRAMARPTKPDGRPTLIQLKAVEPAYPLYGTVELPGGGSLADALAKRDGVWGAAVEEIGAAPHERGARRSLQVGDATVELRAVIAREPDRGLNAFASLGPRLMIPLEAIAGLGLVAARQPAAPGNIACACRRALDDRPDDRGAQGALSRGRLARARAGRCRRQHPVLARAG